MKIIKYIFYSILITAFIIVFLIFVRVSFTWAFDNEAIYSIQVPDNNYKYELYFTEGGGATVAEGYVLRKTYNMLSYSYVVEVLGYRYVYFNEMQLLNNKLLLTFKTGKSLDKLDSLYIKIE